MSDIAFDSIFLHGEENAAFGRYFTDQSYLNMLNTKGVMMVNVTFEPGCRNDRHIRHASEGGRQILLYIARNGWFQVESEAPISLEPGSVVTIPVNRKHWHSVKKDPWFSHIAIEVPGEDTGNEWCEPVSGEYHENL